MLLFLYRVSVDMDLLSCCFMKFFFLILFLNWIDWYFLFLFFFDVVFLWISLCEIFFDFDNIIFFVDWLFDLEYLRLVFLLLLKIWLFCDCFLINWCFLIMIFLDLLWMLDVFIKFRIELEFVFIELYLKFLL